MATYGFCENKCKQELDTVKVSSTEPTTDEKVWIDDTNKKIYVKNDNGEYEEFVNAKNIPSVKKLSVSDFFSSTNYTITDFEAYQYGNIVNIQRMMIVNIGSISETTTVGNVNSKYLPKGKKPIRVQGASGGATFDFLCVIEDMGFVCMRNHTIEMNGDNVYVFNASYIID
jgi:hypothetical protein